MSCLEEFIKRRFPQDSNWLDGNCYWFAAILSHYCKIKRIAHTVVYDVINGHFMLYCYEDGKYYDWEGAHDEPTGYEVDWNNFKDYDELQYERIVEDCVF